MELIPSDPAVKGQHIKKRALKNKAILVRFDEKNLRDFVTGYHKRKKKRRKIAQRQLQEKERLQRIEARRKRKLEKELALYGGALPAEESPDTASGDEENGDDLEHDGIGKIQSISGTKMYENDGLTITVTTTVLSREEDDPSVEQHIPKPIAEAEKDTCLLPKKKSSKSVKNQRSRQKRKKPALQRRGGKKGRGR